MHLSLFTDLGFRVLMVLAGSQSGRSSARALARELKVSQHHLTKVISALSAAGYLQTRRGHRGGVSLAMPPQAIHLGEVVRHLEASTPLVDCFRADGGTCTLCPGCLLKGRLVKARDSFLQDLNTSTLEDIAYTDPSRWIRSAD